MRPLEMKLSSGTRAHAVSADLEIAIAAHADGQLG